MIELDGTDNKSELGANAIVGVSIAAPRAFAGSDELWRTLGVGNAARLPVPHFNVVNGGVHAPNALDFQEFMIAPVGAPNMAEAVRAGAEVYAALRGRLSAAGHGTGLGDEGGFAPDMSRPEDVLRTLTEAITDAGYEPGRAGVAIALDPAASEFYSEGAYHVAGQAMSAAEMIDYYAELVDRFPIWSIEDGLAEQDWDGWIHLTETLAAITLCGRNGYACMVSHRSGETPDTFIADLTVGTGVGQLKSGAPARGERTAKYNRLITIADTEPDLPFGLAR